MSVVYIHCTCGYKFVVDVVGNTIITCPKCNAKYERVFDARSDSYMFKKVESDDRR